MGIIFVGNPYGNDIMASHCDSYTCGKFNCIDFSCGSHTCGTFSSSSTTSLDDDEDW